MLKYILSGMLMYFVWYEGKKNLPKDLHLGLPKRPQWAFSWIGHEVVKNPKHDNRLLVKVKVRNEGVVDWSPDSDLVLATVEPKDSKVLGTKRFLLGGKDSIRRGQIGVFWSEIVLPKENTEVNLVPALRIYDGEEVKFFDNITPYEFTVLA